MTTVSPEIKPYFIVLPVFAAVGDRKLFAPAQANGTMVAYPVSQIPDLAAPPEVEIGKQ